VLSAVVNKANANRERRGLENAFQVDDKTVLALNSSFQMRSEM
jgi:hypothetical protein